MKYIFLALLLLVTLMMLGMTVSENLETKGNLYVGSARTFESPVKFFLGEKSGVYHFYQVRPDGTSWAGIETYSKPPNGPVAAGYGALPLRIWGKGFLLEENGAATFADSVVAPKVHFQKPDTSGFGGVRPSKNLDFYITIENDNIVACKRGKCTPITQ